MPQKFCPNIPDKVIRNHLIAVFGVCLAFCIINLVTGYALTGILTAAMGIIVPLIVLIFMRKASNLTKGIFLTQATAVVIVVLSATKGELHTMAALLAANFAIGSEKRRSAAKWAAVSALRPLQASNEIFFRRKCFCRYIQPKRKAASMLTALCLWALANRSITSTML